MGKVRTVKLDNKDFLGRVSRRLASLLNKDREEFFKYKIGDHTADIRTELTMLLGMSAFDIAGKDADNIILKDTGMFKKVIKMRDSEIKSLMRDTALYQIGLLGNYRAVVRYRLAMEHTEMENLGTIMGGILCYIRTYVEDESQMPINDGSLGYRYNKMCMDSLVVWMSQLEVDKKNYKKSALGSIYWWLDKDGRISSEKFIEFMKNRDAEFGEHYAYWKSGKITEKEYGRLIASDYGRVEEELLGPDSVNQVYYVQAADGNSREEYEELYGTDKRREGLQKHVDRDVEQVMYTIQLELYKIYLKEKSILEKYIKYKKDYADFKSKVIENQEKVKTRELEIGNKVREMKRQYREMQQRVSDLGSERDRALGEVESLRGSGVVDSTPMELEIRKLREEVSEKEVLISEYERTMGKFRGEMSKGNDTYRRMESSYKEAISKIDELTRANNELMMRGNGYDIPVESVLNALKNKKIAIVGGNHMHTKINNIGAKNISVYDGFVKLNGTLNQSDLMVIVTGNISHKVAYEAESIAKKNKIDTYMFNGQNVGMLFKEIFSYIHRS